MRVALDGQPLLAPLAGVGHYTRELVHALAALDLRDRYYVVAPRPLRMVRGRDVRRREFSELNVDVVVAGWWTTMRARLLRRLGRDAELLAGLDPPCDVFHATNNVFPYRVRAARHVLTVHDLTLLLFPEWHPPDRRRLMTRELDPAVRRADHVITPSHATRIDVLKCLPVEPDRVCVIPEGVSGAFAPLPRERLTTLLAPLGLRPGEYLLFLGTLEPRKNLLRLLEAVEQAGPTIGPLVVAGGRGWGDRQLRATLARLQRTGRVRALGYVSDSARPPLLGGARAFVYPSLYEGFGLPPLEAMACGTPVVTSSVASLVEVVGDAALLVDPRDVAALAAALRRIWEDDALRADLAARGRAQARRFTWERTARLTLDVYRSVVG
jgi:glycosyltransferase involved in cell wall biosynthesis